MKLVVYVKTVNNNTLSRIAVFKNVYNLLVYFYILFYLS